MLTCLLLYVCIHVYLSILLFDNSITSSITYHTLSMELKLMINLEIFTRWQIAIAEYKERVNARGEIDISRSGA